MSHRPPHILLIVADQLAAQYLPSYGHRIVQAPNIDGLAAQGVVFEHAYSPSPLCAPARSVLMTGQLPDRTGVYDNAAEFPSSIPTFAHYLRHAGYRTCLSGKMHFVGPDQLHGLEERLTTDIYPADFGWTPDWRLGNARIDWWYHNMSSVKQAGTAEITNQLEYDDDVTFQAIRKIYDHVRYDAPAPLCLCVSFTHPHDPYVARPRYWNLYDEAAIDMPAVPPIARNALDPHSLRLWNAAAMGEFAITERDVRTSRHGYYASISYVDEKIGEILSALEACGIAGDTVVLLTSDHGDFLGERGLWYKMSFLDPASRVPLIVHAPKRFGHRRVSAPVSLADLAPTLADLAAPGSSADLAAPVDGRSLVRLLEGGAENPDEGIFGLYVAEGTLAPIVMIRRGKWKFIACETDPDQLFDLEADPLELNNLAELETETIAAFRRDAARRFDCKPLASAVLQSQKARHLLFRAMRRGMHFPWDYQPLKKASEQYTRNHMDVTARDIASRFPKAAVPDKK